MSEQFASGPAARVLARIIDTSQPDRLLSCGDTATAVAMHWCQQRPETSLICLDPAAALAGDAGLARVDLALVSDVLEQFGHSDGEHLIGLLRNYGAQRIAVLAAAKSGWQFTDFIGLGFREHAQIEDDEGSYTLYTYNLDTYNHEREWNNPKNWANPEMWGKAWW